MNGEFFVYYFIGAASAALFATPLLTFLTVKNVTASNYTGRVIPQAFGLLVLFASWPAWTIMTIAFQEGSQKIALVIFASLLNGMALIGFIDDVAGHSEEKGWRTHLNGLILRKWTAGGIKLLFGGAFIVITVFLTISLLPSEQPFLPAAIRAVLLIGLATNTINSFDLRPGRALKLYFAWFIVLIPLSAVAITDTFYWTLLAPVAASAAVLITYDLHSVAMLGDTGANVLGASIGWLSFVVTTPPLQWFMIASMLVFQLWTEYYSFNGLVERNTWLRTIDEFGRPTPK